jgi:arsenite methyltransferase
VQPRRPIPGSLQRGVWLAGANVRLGRLARVAKRGGSRVADLMAQLLVDQFVSHGVVSGHANDGGAGALCDDAFEVGLEVGEWFRQSNGCWSGMTTKVLDQWAEWLLHRRHGGDPELLRRQLEYLGPVRDRVLDHAEIREGDVVLDVGAGDGLIAFGALERVGSPGRVIFDDISQDLLDHARSLADAAGVIGRCEFVRASADDLREVPDASVDAVTTRSVLIYVARKAQAISEFHRVLRPGGRLSIFEPINRFTHHRNWETSFFGIDVAPVAEIWAKVRALYGDLQPNTDPMLDFDERDLFALVEGAGFREVHLTYEAEVGPPRDRLEWDRCIRSSGNPKIPPLEEAMARALTADERDRFVAHVRPLLEDGAGVNRLAVAYVWARRGA